MHFLNWKQFLQGIPLEGLLVRLLIKPGKKYLLLLGTLHSSRATHEYTVMSQALHQTSSLA